MFFCSGHFYAARRNLGGEGGGRSLLSPAPWLQGAWNSMAGEIIDVWKVNCKFVSPCHISNLIDYFFYVWEANNQDNVITVFKLILRLFLPLRLETLTNKAVAICGVLNERNSVSSSIFMNASRFEFIEVLRGKSPQPVCSKQLSQVRVFGSDVRMLDFVAGLA